MHRIACLVFLIAAAFPLDVFAQQDRQVLLLPSIQYGAPLGVAGGLSVFVPTSESGGFRRQGFIVGGVAGQDGFKVSAGFARIIEYLEGDVRGLVLRTWRSPHNASTDATYAGAEVGLMIAYVFVNGGVAHRISGPSGEHATIASWNAGVQFPIGGWRK